MTICLNSEIFVQQAEENRKTGCKWAGGGGVGGQPDPHVPVNLLNLYFLVSLIAGIVVTALILLIAYS